MSFNAFKRVEIPQPNEVEDKGKNLIKWGNDNLYPQFLNGIYQNVSIQSGIIRSKVHYTVSGGLAYEGENTIKWDLFFKNGNSDYNLQEVVTQASQDFELYNGVLIFVYQDVVRRKFSKIEVGDFDKHRKKIGSKNIFYCEDWSDRNADIQEIEPYNPLKKNIPLSFIIYEERPKQFTEGNKIINGNYPLPPYSGAIRSLSTDLKISDYQLNEISNNFSLGTILNLNNGEPEDEEAKKRLEKSIKDHATGEKNAGGVLSIYNNGKDREASVLNLNGNDLNDRYLSLSKDVRSNILLAHSVTAPILFGIKTEGSLGNATELEIGYNIMNSNYFENRRTALTDLVKYIASTAYNLQGDVYFKEKQLGFLPKKEEVKISENKAFKSKFSDDDVIKLFEKYGKERSSESIYTRALPNEFDADVEEFNVINEFNKDKFEFTQEVKSRVLSLINDGNDFNTIKKSLSLNPSELALYYKNLKDSNLIDNNGKLTNIGRRSVAQQDNSLIEIVYSYDKAPGIKGASILPTTREFCERLVNLSRTRVWTRQDIDNITDFVGRNVFMYRGGWYNNPDTEKATPWCRHIWKQEIIFK